MNLLVQIPGSGMWAAMCGALRYAPTYMAVNESAPPKPLVHDGPGKQITDMLRIASECATSAKKHAKNSRLRAEARTTPRSEDQGIKLGPGKKRPYGSSRK